MPKHGSNLRTIIFCADRSATVLRSIHRFATVFGAAITRYFHLLDRKLVVVSQLFPDLVVEGGCRSVGVCARGHGVDGARALVRERT